MWADPKPRRRSARRTHRATPTARRRASARPARRWPRTTGRFARACGRAACIRIHRGVFAVGHRRLSREGRWMAAVLALGDGAVLSHVSAAALWELRPSGSAPVHVTIPTTAQADVTRRHRRAPHGDASAAGDVTTHDGDRGDLGRAHAARSRRRCSAPAPGTRRRADRSRCGCSISHASRACSPPTPTCRGAATLKRIIPRSTTSRRSRGSRWRRSCSSSARRAASQRPEVNVDDRRLRGRLPLARTHTLIIETDGHRDHGTRIAFERDRVRDGHLMMLGYRVVRITYRRLTAAAHRGRAHDPRRCCAAAPPQRSSVEVAAEVQPVRRPPGVSDCARGGAKRVERAAQAVAGDASARASLPLAASRKPSAAERSRSSSGSAARTEST